MSKISFEGIGAVEATFAADTGVEAGKVVKLTGNKTVGKCSAGDRFCGVVSSVRENGAAVQLGGLAKVTISGSGITAGWVKLVADDNGGVKADSSNGTEFLVVGVDGSSAFVRL